MEPSPGRNWQKLYGCNEDRPQDQLTGEVRMLAKDDEQNRSYEGGHDHYKLKGE